MPKLIRWFLFLALGLLLAWTPAYATDLQVVQVAPTLRNQRLEINADVHFELNDQLRVAVERSIPLYFTADLTVTRSRWWWLDSTVIDTHITWRIVYNPLTRQWRVSLGELLLPVSSLDTAMDRVRHIRGWVVAHASDLSPGVRYKGQLRLRLDTSLLARPVQVNVLNTRSWSVSTPWREFDFFLPSPK